MKIALYHPWIYLHGGIERSILGLVNNSRHQWTIYTGHYDAENTFPEFKNLDIVELKRLSVERSIPSVLKSSLQIFFQKIPLEGHDALAIWCDGLGDLAVFHNHHAKPVFNICSTPLRPVFDPSYRRQAARCRPLHCRLAFHLFRILFATVDRLAWQRYSGVIATSREVKRRILDGGLYDDTNRMQLCHPGINWDQFDDPLELPGHTLLVPGRIMWTKNIGLAISAFINAELPAPWKLVIAGFVDRKSRSYLNDLRKLAQGNPQIEFEESPSDTRLTDLYRQAALVLFPPLNEDWGIVPLEAMASSKPVIANARGGPRESVVHCQTGWLLEPTVQAWVDRLRSLPGQEPLLVQMGRAARLHVKQYDWSVFARGIDQAFEQWAHGKVGAPDSVNPVLGLAKEKYQVERAHQ